MIEFSQETLREFTHPNRDSMWNIVRAMQAAPLDCEDLIETLSRVGMDVPTALTLARTMLAEQKERIEPSVALSRFVAHIGAGARRLLNMEPKPHTTSGKHFGITPEIYYLGEIVRLLESAEEAKIA